MPLVVVPDLKHVSNMSLLQMFAAAVDDDDAVYVLIYQEEIYSRMEVKEA